MCRIAAYGNTNYNFAPSSSSSFCLIMIVLFFAWLIVCFFLKSTLFIATAGRGVPRRRWRRKLQPSSRNSGEIKILGEIHKKLIFFFKTLGGNNQGLWLPCSRWRRPPRKTRNNHHLRRNQVREVGRFDLVPAQQLPLGVDLPRSGTASIVLIARWGWWGSLEIVVLYATL